MNLIYSRFGSVTSFQKIEMGKTAIAKYLNLSVKTV